MDLINGNWPAYTIAGYCGTAGYTEGMGRNARFNNPTGMALDEVNNLLYVADQTNNRIRKIDLATNTTSLVAGNTTSAYTEDIGSSARFYNPTSLLLASDKQTLYLSDKSNHRIRKIDLATNTTSLVAGNGNAALVNGAGTFASFYNPMDLSFGPDENSLYIADYSNKLIRRINLIGGEVYSTFDSTSLISTTSGVYPTSIIYDPVSKSFYISAY